MRFLAHPLLLLALVLAVPAHATEGLTPVPVADGVWAVVGPLGQRAPDNLGNNATFGVIATAEGTVLIDSGASAQGAAALAAVAEDLTGAPVRLVINTGGQDHRWLGNAWFAGRGARIIASAAAAEDQAARADGQFAMLRQLIGAEALAGTTPLPAPETVAAPTTVTLGGVTLRLLPVGPAHTPGDMLVWLPDQRVAFAGDVVFLRRMLGVLPYSNSRHWLAAFDSLAALDPAVVVPGHGGPGTLAEARAQTRDYLAHLRTEVGRVLEAGGDETAAAAIDQSAFAGLDNFDTLAGRNAQQVYMEMEWE